MNCDQREWGCNFVPSLLFYYILTLSTFSLFIILSINTPLCHESFCVVREKRHRKKKPKRWVPEEIVKGSLPVGFSGPTPTNPMPHDVVRSSPNTLKSNNFLALTTSLSSRFNLSHFFHSNLAFFLSGFLPMFLSLFFTTLSCVWFFLHHVS